MASKENAQDVNRQYPAMQPSSQPPPPPPPHGGNGAAHQRSKSNVLRSFMHRKTNSDAAAALAPILTRNTSPPLSHVTTNPPSSPRDMRVPNFSRRPPALAEIQTNRVDGATLSRPSSRVFEPVPPSPSRWSPTKLYSSTVARMPEDHEDKSKKENESPTKPKKTKSVTNLASGLLGRPKSLKNLHRFSSEEEVYNGHSGNGGGKKRDKENRTPPGSQNASMEEARPPIYAQFSSGALEKIHGPPSGNNSGNANASTTDAGVMGRGLVGSPHGSSSDISSLGTGKKPRPQSYHVQYTANQIMDRKKSTDEMKTDYGSVKATPTKEKRGLKLFTTGFTSRQKSSSNSSQPEPSDFVLDPKDIDKHLEAMLDRRNIPENQRYKMRNLNDTIKMEFIRQDWAETQAINNAGGSNNINSGGNSKSNGNGNANGNNNDSDTSANGSQGKADGKTRKSRARSFTLSRNSSKNSDSPAKKKGEGTLGRHFRSKSNESVSSMMDRPVSSESGSGGGILSKIKLQQGPSDFVSYLRKVQKPEAVEVGKLHKLRLLLRNETVAWTDEFVRQGGMQEIVALLHRIMEVEWREEHEDALLHENLLCLKALCTTALALEHLHSNQATLFPALLHLIFDPEKKGPSEFTTRGIITSVLFTYIKSASPQERIVRARTVLAHLRDPSPKEEERPLDFVMEMHRERPYRVWCKEAVSVTKEVFWIFLHHLNVVYLPRDKERALLEPGTPLDDAMAYMQNHFPQERPPVPAAPYVGGVEWDATNYLASHLDLLNAIVACTPSVAERNELREFLRISGWERCMGGSMRLCKEKFYPGIHDALRTWVSAAADDGWNIKDVRYGPPPEAKSPQKKAAGGAVTKDGKKEDLAVPRIEIPRLDFFLDSRPSPVSTPGGRPAGGGENWLS